MFKKIVRKLKKQVLPNDDMEAKENREDELHNKETHPLSPDYDENLEEIEAVFDRFSDIVIREFTLGTPERIRCFYVHIDGICNEDKVNINMMERLMLKVGVLPDIEQIDLDNAYEIVKERVLTISEIQEKRDLIEVVNQVLAGDTALFVEGSAKALILDTKGWEQRDVDEPDSESVIRGPRDGFTETLRTNTALIRRRIKSSRLKIENMKVGVLTKTDVSVVYLDGIVYDGLVTEIKERLERIDTDAILDSGYIQEFIEDNSWAVFPTTRPTERPDSVAAGILEGQAAIIVDTSPFVLVAPATFPQFLQSAEDYYNSFVFGTFLRLLRFLTLNFALLLPSIYVAVVTFHQEMIPTELLISVADARDGVPFPALVEALIMEVTFEILREAGVRLPKQVGQAVSIVGALVIGDAAVSAGLVSPAMVIIVALTAVSSFTIPNISGANAIRMLRFPMIFLAGTLGLYGIMIGLMALLVHLCSLRSFGVPYLSPLAPLSVGDLKDMLVRFPHWAMGNRPRLTGYKEPIRQDEGLKPRPPKKNKSKASDSRGGRNE